MSQFWLTGGRQVLHQEIEIIDGKTLSYTRGASLFLVHKKVHLDYAVSDQTNRSYPNEPLTLYR